MNSSFLYGLLVGCVVGYFACYYKQQFTGNRKRIEKQNSIKQHELNQLINDHPDIMALFKADVCEPNRNHIREFFVVEKNAILHSSTPRFRYELSEEMLLVLNRLEQSGFIEQLKNNCLHYKIREGFIKQMLVLS